MQTTTKYLRIDRREIAYLKFIIEACDGIAVLSTVDPVKGIVRLSIAPGCEAEVERVLQDLKEDVMVEPVDKTEYSQLNDSRIRIHAKKAAIHKYHRMSDERL